MIGNVTEQASVVSSTALAASSLSHRWSSAIDSSSDADGTALKTSILVRNTPSVPGTKTAHRYAKSGNTTSFSAHTA